MARYLISVDAHNHVELTRVLNELMLEKGANIIAPGEWILEGDPNEAMPIYAGIAAVIGNRSVFVKELNGQSWDSAVVSQGLLFEMLGGQPLPIVSSLRERA